MDSKIIKSDFNSLNEFVRGLKSGMVVNVGIFGSKAARADMAKPVAHGTAESIRHKDRSYKKSAGITNAEVGFIHEFGSFSRHIPQRSFLRMPIFTKADQILAYVIKSGALKKLKEGKMIEVLADLGIACEAAIGQAFASSGWGSWKSVKRGGSPLVDTGQLRRSIASTVTNP